MGFPVGYTEVFLPKIFIRLLCFLGLLRSILNCVLNFLGLSDFLDQPTDHHQVYYPENPTQMPIIPPISAVLIRELLPAVKFSDVVASTGGGELPESCAVCLYEFEGGEEIRWLNNCKHIFHQKCLDRWMDYDQKACPLCRTLLVPRHLQEEFNQRLWAATATAQGLDDDYHDDFIADL